MTCPVEQENIELKAKVESLKKHIETLLDKVRQLMADLKK